MKKIIKENERGLLIVVSGPSGAGKDAVISGVHEKMKESYISISYTSRLPRGNEQNGREYFFVSREEFEEKIKNNDFLEYAEYTGNYYGTPKEHIEENLKNGKNVFLIIDIEGAKNIKNLISDAVFIFIMPPSMEELIKRLKGRKTESKDKIIERFTTAYKEINEFNKYNYVVTNDILEESIDKVISIINAEKLRVDRIEEIYLNTKEEIIHELLMDKEFDNSEYTI